MTTESHNNNEMKIISLVAVRKLGMNRTQILLYSIMTVNLKEYQLIQEIYSLTKKTNKLMILKYHHKNVYLRIYLFTCKNLITRNKTC